MLNSNIGRIKNNRHTKKPQWVVVTKYYDSGEIVSSMPRQLPPGENGLGWRSAFYNGYTEFTDYFDLESGAKAFITDNEKEYGESFRVGAA